MILDLEKFIRLEQPFWRELEEVLQRLEQNPSQRLELEAIRRFHYLYQRAASDLGQLMTFSAQPEIRGYLEALVARTYAEIHEGGQERGRLTPLTWFFKTFPRTFRRHLQPFWLALAVTLFGLAFGGFVLGMAPQAKETILPFSHLQDTPSKRVEWERQHKGEQLAGQQAGFSSQLMTHNIKISIFAMGLGLTYGLGTLIILFYNGVVLGGVAFDYILDGQGIFLAGWLLPHGSLEIPAFLISGQAGLVLARALIGRGDRQTLAQRMRQMAPDLATLVGGIAVMLCWAGLVESFFSQYHEPVLPYSVKIGFGLMELILLLLFLSRGGRAPESGGADA